MNEQAALDRYLAPPWVTWACSPSSTSSNPAPSPSHPPGSIDTLAQAAAGAALSQTGTRYRGASQLPPIQSGQTDLGYYCSLPLSDWDQARNAA
ncbi:MAG: hypothetical protein KY469_17700 [Actinobacteria bacterium]|nr:hypothetical protein [Actinomycetota bacterium]